MCVCVYVCISCASYYGCYEMPDFPTGWISISLCLSLILFVIYLVIYLSSLPVSWCFSVWSQYDMVTVFFSNISGSDERLLLLRPSRTGCPGGAHSRWQKVCALSSVVWSFSAIVSSAFLPSQTLPLCPTEEIHAELCYAEVLLQRAALTFLEVQYFKVVYRVYCFILLSFLHQECSVHCSVPHKDESMIGFLKGGMKIRASYQVYKWVIFMLTSSLTP